MSLVENVYFGMLRGVRGVWALADRDRRPRRTADLVRLGVFGAQPEVCVGCSRVCHPRPDAKEPLVSTPDHVENTGDNLRHAAEVQQQALTDDTESPSPPDESSATESLPDFNT
jgi:hypothetical protein